MKNVGGIKRAWPNWICVRVNEHSQIESRKSWIGLDDNGQIEYAWD